MSHYSKQIEKAQEEYNARIMRDIVEEKKACTIFNNVEKPKHYNVHPSGVQCIEVTEHLTFCLGNAIKYIWRHENKNGVEDLKKAVWYIERECKRLEALKNV